MGTKERFPQKLIYSAFPKESTLRGKLRMRKCPSAVILSEAEPEAERSRKIYKLVHTIHS